MNRAYALNRDKLKCRACGGWLMSGTPYAHCINPNLPLNKVNRVNNLVSLHKNWFIAVKERVTLENEAAGEEAAVPFLAQLKAIFTDKYMLLIYAYFLIYTAGSCIKNISLVYFCNNVLGTYNDGITQTMVSAIGGIPMGIGSIYGRVESGWRKTDAGMEFTVTVPANCTARVALPDGSEWEQGAGTRTYFVSEG